MMSLENTIFIPIAACGERFIEQTIKSALINAKNPEKIYFGVFNNILDKSHSLLNNDFITKNKQIFYTEIVTPGPMGTGFARMNASLLQMHNFDFMLQIDAHTLFTKNWDTTLIKVFNKIKDENNINENKIVLSASTQCSWTYDPKNPEEIFAIDRINNSLHKIDPYDIEKTWPGVDINLGLVNGTTKFLYDGRQKQWVDPSLINFPIVYGDRPITDKSYQEVYAVYAFFVFSKANINREVLHDPKDNFHGDQTNYSIRLLSRNYRIFSPQKPGFATLDKTVFKNYKEGEKNEELDPEYNWRGNYERNNNWENWVIYYDNKDHEGFLFFNKMINGEYFGYWGTPDEESLNKTKKAIGYEF